MRASIDQQIVELGRGASVSMMLRATVAAGYHVQANPASEPYLIPTLLRVMDAAGVRVSGVIYPAGKPYRIEGETRELATYDGTFEIQVTLQASKDATPGLRVLSGSLRTQACSERACLPPASTPLDLRVRVNP